MILRAEPTDWNSSVSEGGIVEFPRRALRLAREILSALPDEVEAIEHDAGAEIWYSIRSTSPRVRLRRIKMKASSLDKLETEPHGDVKISYLRRDLLRALPRSSAWSYPRIESVAGPADDGAVIERHGLDSPAR